MRIAAALASLPLSIIPLWSVADGSGELTPSTEAQDSGPPLAVVARRSLPQVVEVEGVFAAADAQEVAFWPEVWSGELVLLEVTPHGTFVNEGDILARVDLRALDEAIEDALRDLATAELDRRHESDRLRLAGQEAEQRLAEATADLARAERRLEGWKETELALKRRDDELSAESWEHNIADQEAELKQLQEMYDQDELIEATEELVLSRAKRNLAYTRQRKVQADERQKYVRDFERALETQRRTEEVESKRSALERLHRTNLNEAEKRADTSERSELALAKKRKHVERLQADRLQLELRAPRAGVLLHGARDQYEPGAARTEYRRGSRIAPRTSLFTVANPDELTVALSIPESKLTSARDGMGVRVVSLAGERTFVGTLALQRYPDAASASQSEAEFDARVDLEGRAAGVVVGMHAKVILGAGEDVEQLVLPAVAVKRVPGEGAWVWRKSEVGAYERVAIELGERHGGDVIVSGALSEGQSVLLGDPR